jgi:hypothetical protein
MLGGYIIAVFWDIPLTFWPEEEKLKCSYRCAVLFLLK